MTGFVVVGTDTDAGKTTFSLHFLHKFVDKFAYWKPVETGESDTAKVRRLVPNARVFDPLARFTDPVAPPLAARREGRPMPAIAEVLAAVPASDLPLLIETFGGVLSPFTDDELQVELVRKLRLPIVLVGSSTLGAIARTLAAVAALASHNLKPESIVLVGPQDGYAEGQIRQHVPGAAVVPLTPAFDEWSEQSIAETAARHRNSLLSVYSGLASRLHELRTGRKAENLLARDESTIWHPYTPLQGSDLPLVVTSAVDEFLELADGRKIIDGISSWWTITHGHTQPALMSAIREATRRLDHVLFAGVTHEDAVTVAEKLLTLMPWNSEGRVFFSDNGSTAVEVALKMAYQSWCLRGEPRRTLFIGFENSYHGDTFGAMAIGRDPLFFGRFEPLLFRTLKVPVSASSLDEALTQNRGEVAGVILEPLVQGAGGMQMHTPEVLREIFEVTRRHAVAFIADEVMTGFGRTGSLFAFEQASIVPDLVCLAKGLTGGVLPLSATLASPSIVREFDTPDRTKTFFHGHSFTANPLACAAAAANLKLLESRRWKVDVDRIQNALRDGLQPLANHPGVKDVRFRGLIAAVEVHADGGYLANNAAVMRRTCLEHGVLLRPLGNVLYAMPPMCTSSESLEKIIRAMHTAVDSACERGKSQV